MKIVRGTIVKKQYYHIEVYVPDDAPPSQQSDAIWDSFHELDLTGRTWPVETDTDDCIYNMEIVEAVE